ncbi:MAG TPA: glycosyltransferase [Candidatus Hydrogenedentes bacterium]|nr:glycosyltransferase [Candidatus Hydrogenedentota bacterium]HNT86916.1 glycosyltransferase [Candidatus Hydrogenedentota bacterium]
MHLGILTPDTQQRCCFGDEERYMRRLLATLRRMQDQARLFLFTSEEQHGSYEGWMRVAIGKVGGGRGGIAGLLGVGGPLARAAKKAGVNALFAPLAAAPVNPPLPLWLYIVDVRPWEPGGDRADDLKQAKRVCAEARGIVAPSEHTRRRCLELFDVPLDKVVVAPPGVDAVFADPSETIVEKPYLMIVGDTCKTHNYPLVFKGLAQIQKERLHTLVVTGTACNAEPTDWGPRGVRIEKCPDAQLAGLYQNAEAVIFATLHDGSGQRILEALRAGGVAVAPNLDAIPEVAGDYVLFYNHESVESFVRAVRRGLQEGPSNLDQRRRASKRAAEFSWEKCAWKALSAFKRG